ncbi:MAG: tetratricopeptide repeat protein [Thermodesulfobacteriota bacterium]
MNRNAAFLVSWLSTLALFAGCAATQHDLLYKGMAQYEAGRYDEAVATLTIAAGTPGHELPWIYKMRAGAYMKLGRFDLALADLERFFPGAADNEDAAHGHLMVGDIHFASGRFDRADSEYEKALDLKPVKWKPNTMKGLNDVDEVWFRKEAQRYVASPSKTDLPEEARKYRVKAETAVGRKAFAEAADYYRDALGIAPWWPEGHYNRALILAELGRYGSAGREMKRYLLLSPDAPDARAAQDKIYEWEALAEGRK